jgi:AcrR family transcriptional regulator
MTTPTPGLRERKKARTRWAIQEHALRLFAEQGYDATTIDQIAAAAEISPSTFFRYFATKEDVVVQDEFDEQFVDAFRAAGASPDPVMTLRRTIVATIASSDPHEREKSRQRMELTLSVPALRARTMQNTLDSFQDAVRGFAEGSGRPQDDLSVHAFVGALLGLALPVLMRWATDGYTGDLDTMLDDALAGVREIVTRGAV